MVYVVLTAVRAYPHFDKGNTLCVVSCSAHGKIAVKILALCRLGHFQSGCSGIDCKTDKIGFTHIASDICSTDFQPVRIVSQCSVKHVGPVDVYRGIGGGITG